MFASCPRRPVVPDRVVSGIALVIPSLQPASLVFAARLYRKPRFATRSCGWGSTSLGVSKCTHNVSNNQLVVEHSVDLVLGLPGHDSRRPGCLGSSIPESLATRRALSRYDIIT